MNAYLNLPHQASLVLIALFKGVLYQDKNPELWRDLLTYQNAVRDYVAVLGLLVLLDETEGYAFLRQRPEEAVEDDEAAPLPRLVQRRQLSYPLSLLCVLLRKKLIEQDAAGGETRVILSRGEIVDMMRVFLPEGSNEAKTVEQIESHIRKVADYGFLRPLKGDEERFEVRRILKALVDADWLGDLDRKLEAYQAHADALA
ncbi:DUF4194 domain-containing protein [Trichloromonas acetexigens]|jgi:hypothetical protein|uniref:DUF4194 domain-containing protein n=1 Tax=Trichloromonas acetexigens TaxID=38815 RepID=A0A550J6E5_9BACT|nr:DUF4194 domain-containing protein [Desulfuromonas acetexigens]TRO78775.1 DUF4194 domain-containing protein [Desulfuromonas acetexigens]